MRFFLKYLKLVLIFLLMLLGSLVGFFVAFVFLAYLGLALYNNYEIFFYGINEPMGYVIICVFSVAGFLAPYWLIRRRIYRLLEVELLVGALLMVGAFVIFLNPFLLAIGLVVIAHGLLRLGTRFLENRRASKNREAG